MKKIYQTPTTDIIKTELQQMIAMSQLGETEETSGNLSRRNNNDVWEDEEEEEGEEW